jgi:hypothetical protein
VIPRSEIAKVRFSAESFCTGAWPYASFRKRDITGGS